MKIELPREQLSDLLLALSIAIGREEEIVRKLHADEEFASRATFIQQRRWQIEKFEELRAALGQNVTKPLVRKQRTSTAGVVA